MCFPLFATQFIYSKAFTSHVKDNKTLVSNFLLYGSEKLSPFHLSSISPLLSIPLLILMFLFLSNKSLLNHVTLPNDQLLLLLSSTTKALERIFWTLSLCCLLSQIQSWLLPSAMLINHRPSSLINHGLRPKPDAFLQSSQDTCSPGPSWLSSTLAFRALHSPSGPPFFSLAISYFCSLTHSPAYPILHSPLLWKLDLVSKKSKPVAISFQISGNRHDEVLLCCSWYLNYSCSSFPCSLTVK